MHTKALFYDDIYLVDFKAKIVEIEKKDNLYHIILDQTAFYPNSGGMPADKGFLNDIAVIDVIKKDDKIIHVLEQQPKETEVIGKVDYQTRIKHIQFHDAQHLLTAILEKDYEFETVSHHVHQDYCDLILSGKNFNQDIIDEVERIANQMIFDQVKMEIFNVKKADLAKYNISDNPIYPEEVRVTNIEGLNDYNACGCLHFDNLSKIQNIKCLGYEKNKNEFKFFFTAGFNMINYFDVQNKIISQLKILSKANEENMIDKISDVYQKNIQLSKELNDTKKDLYRLLLPSLVDNNLIIYHEPTNNISNLKLMAQEIINYDQPIVALLQIKRDDNYQFILVKQKDHTILLEDIFKKLKDDLNITGGGKGLSINGQSQTDLSIKIKDYL